ncbi:hypothetical protein BDZ90DRAFT_260141 [Jaminaea rosea]|uniref:DUF6924 domain-containing protein n=1 Tax=Jaminaea rosea TaxID=1569628 RepID=A0A316URP5_9BASI|nr:hypothetical protein BDZ90DRAFT_260141 [Jaminaea rosea]PWN27654.1 hypothetical protein BDZ90DRAFT_260141 [Jaminaea rosea]
MSSLPLFNVAGASSSEVEKLLAGIRSTSYIAEVTSNEVPPGESGLWDAVVPVNLPDDCSQSSSIDEQVKALVAYTTSAKLPDSRSWSASFLIIDSRTSRDGSLLAVEVGEKKEIDRMRVAPKSVVEVASNLAVQNMPLAEYKAMCKNAEIFDDGR